MLQETRRRVTRFSILQSVYIKEQKNKPIWNASHMRTSCIYIFQQFLQGCINSTMSFPRLDIQISLHNDLKLHNGETPLWLVQPLPFHAISASSSTWKTLTARMANASCIPR